MQDSTSKSWNDVQFNKLVDPFDTFDNIMSEVQENEDMESEELRGRRASSLESADLIGDFSELFFFIHVSKSTRLNITRLDAVLGRWNCRKKNVQMGAQTVSRNYTGSTPQF